MRDKQNTIFIILSLLFLAVISSWLYMNDFTTAHADDTNYLTKAYDLSNCLKQGWSEFWAKTIIIDHKKPPLLIYYFTLLIVLFNRVNHELIFYVGVLLLNLAFVFNLFYFFKIVLTNNKVARNFALCFFLLSPLLFGVTKLVMVEPLLLNLIMLTWTLIYAWRDNLTRTKSFTLGLVLGLGFLAKATFPIFVFAPLVYIFSKNIKSIWSKMPFLIMGFSISLPWYLEHLIAVIVKFYTASKFVRHTDGPVFSLKTIGGYSYDLLIAFGLFSFILFILLFLIKSPKLKEIFGNKYLLFVAFGPILNFITFFFVSNKNERFQFVSLFFFVVLLSILISKVISSESSKRRYVSKVLVGICLLAQTVYSFHIGFVNIFPDLQYTKILYTTRPYRNFFRGPMKLELDSYFAKDDIDIYVDPEIVDKGIEVEWQPYKKNPRTIEAHFDLIKSRHGFITRYRDLQTMMKEAKTNRNFLLAVYDENKPLSEKLRLRLPHKPRSSSYAFQRIVETAKEHRLNFALFKREPDVISKEEIRLSSERHKQLVLQQIRKYHTPKNSK